MASLQWIGSLYRLVLRTNRALAPELRTLGDAYANAEFKLIRNAEKGGKMTRASREAFVSEWTVYCESVAQQIEDRTLVDDAATSNDRPNYVGQELPDAVADGLSPDQKVQLQRLQLETLRLHRKERQ
jgi:hypothetical protein